MARIEIPALYRLDHGSSKWGWHKMSDLIEAVNNLLFYSPLDALGEGEDSFCQTKPDYMRDVRSHELLKRFGHLSKGEVFMWSNGSNIESGKVSDVPYADRGDLFVPARWGLDVISEVKRLIVAASSKADRR
ncbi:MAG: hypothetical protein V4481_03650 [Patescibacteria group bacterium]